MKRWRTILFFLILNIVISALTTWAVVSIIQRNQPSPALDDQAAEGVQPGEQGPGAVVTQPGSFPGGGQPVLGVVPDLLAIEAVIGPGELETERVQIQHVGEKEVSLVGWQLRDENGLVYNFPALTMFQGGSVTVFTRSGTSTVVELYWGQDTAVWEPGETAYLVDPEGEVRAVYIVP